MDKTFIIDLLVFTFRRELKKTWLIMIQFIDFISKRQGWLDYQVCKSTSLAQQDAHSKQLYLNVLFELKMGFTILRFKQTFII